MLENPSAVVTLTLIAACGITAGVSRLQLRSHAYLLCVLLHGFSRKGETACSLYFKLIKLTFLLTLIASCFFENQTLRFVSDPIHLLYTFLKPSLSMEIKVKLRSTFFSYQFTSSPTTNTLQMSQVISVFSK